jgi:hypothetical protein
LLARLLFISIAGSGLFYTAEQNLPSVGFREVVAGKHGAAAGETLAVASSGGVVVLVLPGEHQGAGDEQDDAPVVRTRVDWYMGFAVLQPAADLTAPELELEQELDPDPEAETDQAQEVQPPSEVVETLAVALELVKEPAVSGATKGAPLGASHQRLPGLMKSASAWRQPHTIGHCPHCQGSVASRLVAAMAVQWHNFVYG